MDRLQTMKTFFRVAVKVALPLRPGYWWSISPWRPCLARRSRSRSRTGVYAPPMTFRIAGKQYIGFDFRLWDDGQCIVERRSAIFPLLPDPAIGSTEADLRRAAPRWRR
jgi:hypothetical protein